MRQRRSAVGLLFLTSVTSLPGCGDHNAHTDAFEPPAAIVELNDEDRIATLKLTPAAEQRLAIVTVAAEEVDIARRRTVGGEVIAPPGKTVTVSAPIAGTVTVPDGAEPVVAGSTVRQNQVVFHFKPLSTERHVLTPAERINMANARALLATSQIEAQREVQSARLRKEAAQIVIDRARQLFADEAGSQRSIDEADAQLKLAQEAIETAAKRDEFLSSVTLDVETGELTRSEIEAPVGGVIQHVTVAPGEMVAAGDPLFVVANLDRLWIRVPVYVGYRHAVDAEKGAAIRELGQLPQNPPTIAKTIVAPRIADSAASSVDFYFAMENEDGHLYPGQKVLATLTMQSTESSLIVPWSSVLFDIHGAAWVYVKTEPQTYERRRIELRFVENDRAILSAGPPPGSHVVTDGAAELFGREFYYIIKPGASAH